jgi:hypothetical protein
MITILHNLALFWVKNANFSQFFFGENILKIKTSVPGHPGATDVVHRSGVDSAWRGQELMGCKIESGQGKRIRIVVVV